MPDGWGAAACQRGVGGARKLKVGAGGERSGYSSCVIFKALKEIESLGQFPPYPCSVFSPQFDLPPWGLH